MKNKFICIKCGLCCRNIDYILELKEYDLGNGTCKYLDTKTNSCTIYYKRPEVCNVEKSYAKFYHKYYTEEEYLRLNYEGCKLLWKIKKIKKRKNMN